MRMGVIVDDLGSTARRTSPQRPVEAASQGDALGVELDVAAH